MKTVLSIETEKFSEIESVEQRKFVEIFITSLSRYHRDHRLNKGVISRECIEANHHYIDMLFMLIDFLYQYYELSQRHFELLDLAVTNLKRLYETQLSSLSPEDETKKTEIKTTLGDYLDKAALIFQAASDKTEDRIRRELYMLKARDYSRNADGFQNEPQIKSYAEKIAELYERAAHKYSHLRFLEDVFLKRACEYRGKCEAERVSERVRYSLRFSYRAEKPPENQPLLGSDLHKRKPFFKR